MVVNDWSGEILNFRIRYIFKLRLRTSFATIQTLTSFHLARFYFAISAFTGVTTTSSEIAVLESIFKLKKEVQSSIVRIK